MAYLMLVEISKMVFYAEQIRLAENPRAHPGP